MFCSNCGNKLEGDSKFCPKCGNNLDGKQEVEYAKASKRLYAWFIDEILLFAVGFVIVILLMLFTGVDNIESKDYQITIILNVILVIYLVVTESSEKQASIGKRCMNIKVINEDNSKTKVTQMILRVILYLIPVIQLASYITILATEKKQAVWDMILKQVVVEEN